MNKIEYKCVAHPTGSRGPVCGGEPKEHRIDRPTVMGLPMHGFVAQAK